MPKHDADDVFDEWTRSICPECRRMIDMKGCKEFLLSGGKQIPFCAYNSIGYREQTRAQLAARDRARARAERAGVPYTPEPITFRVGAL